MNEPSFFSQIEPQDVQSKLKRIPIYLRLLSVGKVTIGLMVLLLIAVVVIVPFMKSDDESIRIAVTQQPITANAEKPVMKNPRFESVDVDGQPFTIRALEAVQQDNSLIALNKVNADISLNSGLWLALSAQAGDLDISSQKIHLSDKVHLIASNGYELRAPEVFVDMKINKANGENGVKGQGPMGNISADEFTIEGDAMRVLFKKNVKLVIYP